MAQENTFVFGKFLPFHCGHEALIRFALSTHAYVYVLVCAGSNEQLSGEVRQTWIRETFASELERMYIVVVPYDESRLPNTSVSSREVSALWAAHFNTLLQGKVQSLVTSEPYGEYVASYMQIKHITYDPARKQVSISATKIRQQLSEYWHFLPAAVQRYYATKVVILGSESVGKTTLTQFLGDFFKAHIITEAARDLIAHSEQTSLHDLLQVIALHTKNIEKADCQMLTCIDTDWHITASYAHFLLQTELEVSQNIVNTQKAHLYLYLTCEVPYVQDGTRLAAEARLALDQSHKDFLREKGVNYVLISGNDWHSRTQQAINHIRACLALRQIIC
ncbi:MAG: cytidyltransferase [Cytophagales bacterium]|nr:MAG: cytidyltransferase [Cytophagales bacterium]